MLRTKTLSCNSKESIFFSSKVVPYEEGLEAKHPCQSDLPWKCIHTPTNLKVNGYTLKNCELITFPPFSMRSTLKGRNLLSFL